MRRRCAVLLLAILGSVACVRLSAAAIDTEAMRCAIACGHAGAVKDGAACCPMGHGADGGPAFKTCPGGEGSVLVPFFPGQTIPTASAGRIDVSSGSRPVEPLRPAGPRSAFARAPEKVPLLLG
jgi:hypothetical protein